MINIFGGVYKVKIDRESGLGFRLDKAESDQSFDIAEPKAGGCRIVSDVRIAEADVRGTRIMPKCFFPGIWLEIPAERFWPTLHGALILQGRKAVGIVQATTTDAWGYPLLLLQRIGDNRVCLKKSPLLVDGFSKTLECSVDDLTAAMLKTSLGEIKNPLLLNNDGGPFDDMRCLYMGGIVFDSECMVIDVHDDAQFPFARGEYMAHFHIDKLIEKLKQGEEFDVVVGINAARVAELDAVAVPPFATKITQGVYLFDWIDAPPPPVAPQEDEDDMTSEPSLDEPPEEVDEYHSDNDFKT